MSGDGNKSTPRRALARGLSALIADADGDSRQQASPSSPTVAPIENLKPCPFQPRRRFDKEALDSLAASIRSKGILQPLVVRPDSQYPGTYEVIAGERRWRAAQIAQLHEVPILVHELSDREALEIGLVENVQRADLTPMEEAAGYRRLIDEFDHSQNELARIIGKSRSHVANTLRLLGLNNAVKAMVDEGHLSAGHARALLAAEDNKQVELAEIVVSRGLNVRQTEALLRKPAALTSKSKLAVAKDADTRAIERRLADHLDVGVSINHAGPGGSIALRYKSLAALDDLLSRLGIKDN